MTCFWSYNTKLFTSTSSYHTEVSFFQTTPFIYRSCSDKIDEVDYNSFRWFKTHCKFLKLGSVTFVCLLSP